MIMDNQKIVLELSVDDINIILKALGERPFKEVYELIGQINAQAVQQTQRETNIDKQIDMKNI